MLKTWIYTTLPIYCVCFWLCPYTVWSLGKISDVVTEVNQFKSAVLFSPWSPPSTFHACCIRRPLSLASARPSVCRNHEGGTATARQSDQERWTFLSLSCWLLSLLFLGSYLSCLAFEDSISFWFVWNSKEMEIKVISCWIVCPLHFIRGVSSHLHEGRVMWSQK